MIVSNITLEASGDEIVATGGELALLSPWNPDTAGELVLLVLGTSWALACDWKLQRRRRPTGRSAWVATRAGLFRLTRRNGLTAERSQASGPAPTDIQSRSGTRTHDLLSAGRAQCRADQEPSRFSWPEFT